MSTNTTLNDLLAFFWQDYSSITPAAPRIHAALAARGENPMNDHIAFRTYDLDPINVDSLGAVFLERGYSQSGEYHFEQKKLYARSYAPSIAGLPHIFISELLTGEFSAELQKIVAGLVAQVSSDRRGSANLFTQIPTWNPVAYDDYLKLQKESEYAAWLAAFGIRVNHFTVLVNTLKTIGSLQEFNKWLKAEGYELNVSGGEIKGTPEELLEQSSIMAQRVEHTFADGEHHAIPSCYHEFAQRYPDPATGQLYNGFIARSADRIFESTDSQS